MKTVRTSRNFHGPVISLRALCRLEDRPLPYSIADVVADDGMRQFNGRLSSGDVHCTWKLTVWQNGFWSVSADFHDDGTVAGDFFFAEFLLDKGQAFGVKLEGSILNIAASRSLSLEKSGSDRRIRENWYKFPGGPSVRLHAAPSIGGLVAAPIIAFASAPFVVFAVGAGVAVAIGVISHLAAGGTFAIRPCKRDGLQEPSNQACVEVVPVGPPPPPGEPPPTIGQPPP